MSPMRTGVTVASGIMVDASLYLCLRPHFISSVAHYKAWYSESLHNSCRLKDSRGLLEGCRAFAITSVLERWSLSSSQFRLRSSLPTGCWVSVQEFWLLIWPRPVSFGWPRWGLVLMQLLKLEKQLASRGQNLEATLANRVTPFLQEGPWAVTRQQSSGLGTNFYL